MNDSWTVAPVSPEDAGVVARLRTTLDGFTVALFAAWLTPGDLQRRLPDPFGDES